MSTSVIDAVVDSDTEGLLVRWSLDGDDVGVDIGVGTSPDAIDHVHTLTVEAGRRSARIYDPGPGAGRHFVSVAPHGGGGAVVAAERRVPFEGVTNFQDLGGYPTTDSRRTRWGRVFRSDALHRKAPVLSPAVEVGACPACAVSRWLRVHALAAAADWRAARGELADIGEVPARDETVHDCARPVRWPERPARWPMFSAIDRHGWVNEALPLSVRSITTGVACRLEAGERRSASPG